MAVPKIGLVLGGGGSRGLAHIGVLKILHREQIPIDFIVGTSMGGVIGSLYALGLTPSEIMNRFDIPAPTPLENVKMFTSRARQRRWRKRLSRFVGDKTFADLQFPLVLMAVDMISGEEVLLKNGPLLPALLATSAVPGVFPPVNLNGRQLADGGVIDSLATHVAVREGAERIIAVDVHPALENENPWDDPISAIMGIQLPIISFNSQEQDEIEQDQIEPAENGRDKPITFMGFQLSSFLSHDKEKVKIPNPVSSMWRAVRVMTWHLHQKRLADHPPDILMRPSVDQYGSLDFKDISGPIQAGIDEAERHVEILRKLLQRRIS